MRVGMLIGSLNRGGSERVLVNIAEYLVQRGDTVTLVTQFREKNEYPLSSQIKRIVFGLTKAEETGSRLRDFRLRLQKLTALWQQEKPDVILSFIGKNNFMAIYTGHKLGIPIVVSVRANKWMEYYNPLMTFLADFYLGRAEAVVMQGPELVRQFPKRVRKKTVILKNPIASDFFENTEKQTRGHTVISVGRVDENKNHRLLVDAFCALAPEYPEWTLIIYGEGELRQKLLSYIREKGFSDRVFLPGATEQAANEVKKAGVFVLPSDAEGAPNALIEAMVTGAPCIATDCPIGIPRELITHGVNGLLTPVGDVEKMKENLQFLLDNIQKREEIGAEARKTADIYSPEKTLAKWEELLYGVAATKP